MNKYNLIDDTFINQTCLYQNKPIILNPDLALIFGDSDMALIFQQLHYWINLNKEYALRGNASIDTFHEGRFWCFQTYEEWNKEFKWISYNTVRRKMQKLENLGVVISGNFNKLVMDRTKWYTIDYKRLLELQNEVLLEKEKELEEKERTRKEKEKIRKEKFKANKQTKKSKSVVDNYVDNFSTISENDGNFANLPSAQNEHLASAQNEHLASAQNEHLDMPKMGVPIQETNRQEINYIQETNRIQYNNLSVIVDDDEIESEEKKYILPHIHNSNYNYIIDMINNMLNQKTVTISKQKIYVIDIINKLKLLSTKQIINLINYTSKTYENINKNEIKNPTKYLNGIFINALNEEKYLNQINDNDKQKNQIINDNEYNKILNQIRELIDYDDYLYTHKEDKDLADEVIDILIDMSISEYTDIKGNRKPKSIINGIIKKIDYFEFESIVDELKNKTEKIYNISAYVKTLVYTKCLTNKLDINNRVMNDFYGVKENNII